MPTVTNDSTREDALDATTNVASIGGGSGAVAEPDFVFQNTNSVSRKVGTTLSGFYTNPGTTVDMTAADRQLWMCKIIATNKDALLPIGSPALQVRIGSATTAYYELDIHGNETYPLKGGWIVIPINPNEAAYQSNVTGSPSLTAIDYYGITSDFSAVSKGENLAMDAVDIGIGLVLTSTSGTFASFVADDQGDKATGRFGFFTTIEGILQVFGNNWIGRDASGTTQLTTFTDDNVVIIFPDGLFGDGDSGFSIDLGNASTSVSWDSITIIGRGIGTRARFNTETQISSAADEIQATAVIEAFNAGDAVIARSQSGGETPGITNGTRYWVGKNLTATPTGITLHTTRNNALLRSGTPASGTPVNLTASSATNGEIWRLDKDPDTRPRIVVTGTSGIFNIANSSFTNVGVITLTSVCTIDSCIFINCQSFTQSGAPISDSTFNLHATIEGETFITATDLADFTGCSFDNTDGRGHAIKITTTGTYAFTGNTFTGYDPTTYEKSFHTITDVDATNDEITITSHPYTTGDAVVYSDEGLSDTIGLTDNTVYYVRSVTANTISFHANEGDAINNKSKINLSDGGAGQTHKLYGANAAIWNDSGGLVTINVTSGSTPSIRNTSGSTTTVNNSITYTLTDIKSGSEVRIFRVSDGIELDGVESSGTSFSYGYTYAGDTPIIVHINHIDYEWLAIADTLISTNKSTKVFQRVDRNFSNPV